MRLVRFHICENLSGALTGDERAAQTVSIAFGWRLIRVLLNRLGPPAGLSGNRQCKRFYKLDAKDRAGVDLNFAALGQQQAGQQTAAERRRARRCATARQQDDTRSRAADAGAAVDVLSRLFAAMAAAHFAFVVGLHLLVFIPVINAG